MAQLQLIVDGEIRRILSLNYEYFHPADKSKEQYLKILYKNYPYEWSDLYNTFPYQYHMLPALSHEYPDKMAESEARRRSSLKESIFMEQACK